ncbi:hypothetical protein L1987_07336 [Smallanthus sonchifolius]|uniref:Uncharacterized protein n=1 Tax=Smallanthus sonchifolius TaxID=185202 RepID=A0ACB9K0G2_9ASTR|nr:hypothetical protein L1987_07336 [Smallanthus sonchifolius]
MSLTLRAWRDPEGIPTTYEAGESSRAPRPLPMTGEPVDCTVPVLVARGDLYEHQIRVLRADLRNVQEDMSILKDLTENAFVVMEEQQQFDQALRTMCDRVFTTEERLATM